MSLFAELKRRNVIRVVDPFFAFFGISVGFNPAPNGRFWIGRGHDLQAVEGP